MTHKHWLAALLCGLLMTTTADTHAGDDVRLLTDFSDATEDFGWFVVNDNVMGGRSDGGFDVDNGKLFFAGRTNTRGGGFSSIRTRGPTLDLSAYDGVRLRVKGDGRRYTWQIRTDATYRGRDVSYWAEFDTVKDQWITVDLPFSSFAPKFRGFELRGGPPDPARIRGMGLMIYDGRDGPFALTLTSVQAYAGAEELFTLDQYRWQKRVLLISASSDDDAAFLEQTRDIDVTIDEFNMRDMLLITLLDSKGSGAGGRALSDDEVARARKAVDLASGTFTVVLLGKDGGIKLRETSPTSMRDIYALIDAMPMRQREMRRESGGDDA